MSENVIQTSFSAGELSPSLFARVDFAKYKSGAAVMRNFFSDYRSGASTRPGTEFIRPVHNGVKKARLVRFQQSTTVTFIIEFGPGYLRFISNGASIVLPPVAIGQITNAAPAFFGVGTVIPENSLIFVTGVQGMPEINNRYFITYNTVGGSFNVTDGLTSVPVNSTNYGVYGGGGTAQPVYEIGSPYTEADLPLLKFSQNASVMNITHPNHPPYKLTLINATNWVLEPVVVGANVASPAAISADDSGSGAGPAIYKYTVTAIDQNNQEAPPQTAALIGAVADLRITPGSNFITWSPGGPLTGGSAVDHYNVYGTSPLYVLPTGPPQDLVGFIGSTDSTVFQFIDSNIAPDFSQTPPIHDNPFVGVNPACSSYFQQRLVYANGGGELVSTFWASKTGAYYNFDISNPIQANDAISGALVSLEVNEIKSMIPMPTGLIMLTTNGAWQVNGGAGGVATQGGPITPASATATPQAYIGANDVPPIVVNYDILFVQSKGSIVRDLTFNIYSNIYTGNDISVLSSHLFYNHQILEWSYAEEPFKCIWAVREDGILLCLTLVKEQDMYGWSRHDTLGNFKSVASVTEGQFDATYFIVERPNPVGFGTVLLIERLADRLFQFGAEDSWCVDAGLKTTANFPPTAITLNTSLPGPVSIILDAPVLSQDPTGWILRMGGGIVRVDSVTNPQVLQGTIIQKITDVIPNDPLNRPDKALAGTWTLDKPFTVVHGLDHLEGRPVSVLADGGVVNGLVVQNGSITLPAPATKVIAGYGFQAQLQTMYLDLGNEVNSSQGKRKKVGALTVRVKDSRGVKAGRTFETVTPIKELNRVTSLNLPVKLVTADERIVMDPLWDVPGQICLQVDDPLPATVLGVIPEVVIGDSSK